MGICVISYLEIERRKVAKLLACHVEACVTGDSAFTNTRRSAKSIQEDLSFSQTDDREKTPKHIRERMQLHNFAARNRAHRRIDCLHSERVGHIADEIIRRESTIIEKRSVHKKYGRYTELLAKRRSPLSNRRISIIECHKHRSGR